MLHIVRTRLTGTLRVGYATDGQCRSGTHCPPACSTPTARPQTSQEWLLHCARFLVERSSCCVSWLSPPEQGFEGIDILSKAIIPAADYRSRYASCSCGKPLSESEGSIWAWGNTACRSAAGENAVLPSSKPTTMPLSMRSEKVMRGFGRPSMGNDATEAPEPSVSQPTKVET